MLRAAIVVLLLLFALLDLAHAKVITRFAVQQTSLSRVHGYISSSPLWRLSNKLGPSASRHEGAAVEGHSGDRFLGRNLVSSLCLTASTLPCGQKTVEALFAASGKDKNSAEIASLFRPNTPSWQQHLVGVWHFYFPSSLLNPPFISSRQTPSGPLPLWVTEDGEVSCPDLKCDGLIVPAQRSPQTESPDYE